MINPVSGSSSNNPLSQTALAKAGFSQDTFLQLLVTQLKYQDPLNPQESHEFVAQLANFSTLEQMAQINKQFQTLLEFAVTGLIGRTVTVQDSTDPSGFVTGVVKGITYFADGPAVKVNGKDYPFSAVQNVQ